MKGIVSTLPGVGAFVVAAATFQGMAIASSPPQSSYETSEWQAEHSNTPNQVAPQEHHHRTSNGGSSQTTSVTMIFVSPLIGHDATGDGTQRSPFRTLTYALERASAGTTIMLAPGIYSADTGEQFPIRLKRGVTVHGNPGTRGDGVLIRGGGDFVSLTATRQNIAILGANQATLTGVTVTNPNPRGYGIWIESSSPRILDNTLTGNLHDGVSVNGTSAPLIQRNQFVQNGANGVTVFGRSHPRIQDNVFENTGYGINLGDAAAPIIVNNHIVNNRSGVVAQEQSRPVLRHNRIEDNQQNGVVAIAQAQPNLGTQNDPGHNQFSSNGQHAINAQVVDVPVIAAGNQIDPARVVGPVNFEAQTASAISVASIPDPVPVADAFPPTVNAGERITTPPPSPARASALIPATPLSAENATELIPMPVSSAEAASEPASDASVLIPDEPLSAANATELIPIQSSSPPLSAQERSTTPTVAVPASVDSASRDSASRQSHATPTASFPQPTALTAATSAHIGNGALSIDEFVAPESRPTEESVEESFDDSSSDSLNNSSSPVVIQVNDADRFPRSTQRLIRPALHRAAASTEPETSSDSLAELSSGQSSATTPPPMTVSASITSASVTESIPIQVIDPPAPARLVHPQTQVLLTNPATTSGFEATSETSSDAASVHETPRLINPAARSIRPSSVNPSVYQSLAIAPQHAFPQRNENLLPVPSSDVPHGHVGDMARVNVGNNPLASRLGITNDRASLRYRVVVAGQDAMVEAVRAISPGAFQTWLNGRSLIQVGAFASLENANEIARLLSIQGIQAEIQPMQ